ncbi:hypothetical protein E4U36_008382 [Claviceps purpurea]|nr:hypothetical protein E4U36_008382 [Claviceps purpurea]
MTITIWSLVHDVHDMAFASLLYDKGSRAKGASLSAPPSLLSPPSPPSQRSSTKSTLKRWLDNYSENDICTLVKKMLNWLESGHDQYEELASRHVASKPTNLLNDFSPA